MSTLNSPRPRAAQPVALQQRIAAGVFRVPLIGRALQLAWHVTRSGGQRFGLGPAASRYLRTHPIAKLHLGASFKGIAGWFNTDLYPTRWPVMRMDAARSFPLPSESFHFVFCEHMIEHLPLQGARNMVAESFRVLRGGGRIRIATPDLARLVRAYATADEPAHRRYFGMLAHNFALPRDLPEETVAFNSLFYLHGHRFIFDEATLGALLRSAGFVDVKRHAPGESDTPELRGIEIHQDVVGIEANNLETLVLEARKP